VEALLGQPLQDWVIARRAAGRTWKSIATDLAEVTEGQCDLNKETLRAWYAEVDPSVPLGRSA
jgi:hypothetical protein